MVNWLSRPSASQSHCYLDENWSKVRFTAPISFQPVDKFVEYARRSVPMFRIVISSLLLASCATVSTASNITSATLAGCDVVQCIKSFDTLVPGYDLFPVKSYATAAAERWSVQYYPSFKVINNTIVNEQYVLYQCGSTPPTTASASTIRSDAKYFQVPVQRACVDETVPATFIEMLGVRASVKLMDVTYVTSACLNTMSQLKQLPSFERRNQTIRASQIANQCDIVYGTNTGSPDIKTVSYGVSLENTMLGRAEWIKFLALFYNKEAAANDIFTGIQQRYQGISSAATTAATNTNNKPLVAWIQWLDPMYTSKPFEISFAPYKMNLVTDAGGVPFKPAVNDPAIITIAYVNASDFQQALLNVDIVIDETYQLADYNAFLNKFSFSTSQMSSFKFLANNNVWRNDRMIHNIADDWFESAFPNADAVLNDMVSIVQPTVGVKPRTWFRNIAKNETQFTMIDMCNSLTAPTLPINAPSIAADNSISCPPFLLDPAPHKQSSGVTLSPLFAFTAISGFAAAVAANLF